MTTQNNNVNPNVPVVIDNLVSLGTLQAVKPVELVSGASEMAKELAKIIDKQHLYTVISGKKFVNVEGWTTLAVMLGCVAREISTVENDGVYIAEVELVRLSDGFRIGKASAECGEESPWSKRAKYARRSMAQTRATSKACRLAFSWIMQLAGYEVTPAEEMQTTEATQLNIISSYQLISLNRKISDYGLDINRVIKWVNTAWNVNLESLTHDMYNSLMQRIEKWAAQEYAKSEAISGLHTQYEQQFEPALKYANIRG